MSKLRDGESRVMKPRYQRFDRVKVTAERIDSDTPIVHLKVTCGLAIEVSMWDDEAEDLIARLQRALSILPSSK